MIYCQCDPQPEPATTSPLLVLLLVVSKKNAFFILHVTFLNLVTSDLPPICFNHRSIIKKIWVKCSIFSSFSFLVILDTTTIIYRLSFSISCFSCFFLSPFSCCTCMKKNHQSPNHAWRCHLHCVSSEIIAHCNFHHQSPKTTNIKQL